ncbi:MAG: ABC transporter permease [Bacteroidales bacterium]|nr:ABC transporter permease [Bacteroidales bacterium]MBR0533903.1 ABC transporter permease [Bacteroidales bacterium]
MKSFWNFLKKNKLYGAINIIGLTVSMAFVLLLAVYVQRQLSTDSFQENADRIFVIANENDLTMGYWLDKHLKNQFPEIEKGCCVANMSSASPFHIDGEGGVVVHGRMMSADSTFFDIFSYELAAGSKADWHVSWDRCMISEEFANAHFGDKDPIGRQLYSEEGGTNLTVCGVMKDFGNSVLKTPDVLVRGEMMPKTNPAHDEYMSNAAGGICFVMTYPGADLSAKKGDLLNWLEENFWVYKSNHDQVRIIPLRELYFLDEGNFDWSETVQTGNRDFVNLLLAMCLLLLAFAVLNYINMTTALTGFRAKEMATRRLVGADKSGIFLKVIAESTIICGISMLLAILLAEGLAPLASRLLAYPVSIFKAVSPVNVLLVLAFIAVLGILAGIVPALLIQRAQPIEIVRGTLRLKTKTVYSKVIIVLQNVVSVVMLVSALTMGLQIRHLITADLGYNTKDILVIENDFGQSGQLRPLLDRLREETCVEEVGQGNGIPLEGTNNVTMEVGTGNWVSFQQIQGDDKYFQILGLKEKQDNHQRAWWLNEYAFKLIGIDESETEYVTSMDGSLPIGGVYYDFKVRPLESAQSAAMVYNWKESPDDNYPWVLVVKTNGDQNAARKKVEAVVEEVFPGRAFVGAYIEEMIEDGFKDESRVLNIVLIFTLLSILVSALGLFAMSSYYMQQEIRSVSVKKVFGAEYSGVLKDLVLAFMKMMGIAFVIGVPIAWFIMNRWLSGYGHRISLHWWIFVLAGLVVALIAIISVLYQSVKTARTNPAEALKKE